MKQLKIGHAARRFCVSVGTLLVAANAWTATWHVNGSSGANGNSGQDASSAKATPSRWPVADVGARQPFQRAFTALAVRRKEHPLSDGNLREVYHNWRRRAIRQQQFVNVSQRDKCRPLPALRTGMKILIGKRWARTGNVSASRRARGRQNKPGEGRNCRTDHASWRDGFQDYYAVKSHLAPARRRDENKSQ